jgi:hypothetical protein
MLLLFDETTKAEAERDGQSIRCHACERELKLGDKYQMRTIYVGRVDVTVQASVCEECARSRRGFPKREIQAARVFAELQTGAAVALNYAGPGRR